MASALLADSVSQAKGITAISLVLANNVRAIWSAQRLDSNYVALTLLSGHQKLGHLAREAAQFLAPLLRKGIQAHG